ncbi:MAG: hypothetical protein AVDCRST_MAG76-562, partial [uncultured Acidimicrobiales bacterium]
AAGTGRPAGRAPCHPGPAGAAAAAARSPGAGTERSGRPRPHHRPRHHGRLVDRRPAVQPPLGLRRRRAVAQRRGLPLLTGADPDPQEQLRHEQLCRLRDAGVAVLAAHGQAGGVDARAGPGRRLHQPGLAHLVPLQPCLPVAGGQRGPLRLPQPAVRAMALVHQWIV